MPNISFNDFIKFNNKKTDEEKRARIAAIMRRSEYDPKLDHYKKIRETIIRAHRVGVGISDAVVSVINEIGYAPKKRSYLTVLDAYLAFIADRETRWFSPIRRAWYESGFIINVNTNVGLYIDGVPHLIKLYFDNTPLDDNAIQMPLLMMEQAMREISPSNCMLGILDVRRSKLHFATQATFEYEGLLYRSVFNFVALWVQMEQELIDGMGKIA